MLKTALLLHPNCNILQRLFAGSANGPGVIDFIVFGAGWPIRGGSGRSGCGRRGVACRQQHLLGRQFEHKSPFRNGAE